MFGTPLRSEFLIRSHVMAQADEKFTKILNFSANSDIDLLSEFNKSITMGCKVIVGLYTSRECLLVGPTAVQNDVLVVSPTCGHNDIEKFHPHVLTGVPAIRDYMRAIVEKMPAESLSSEVIVFYQPTDVLSDISYRSFKNQFTGKYETLTIDRDGKISAASRALLVAKYKSTGSKKTVLFLAYPLPSSIVVGQLDQIGFINSNVSIFGSSSWIFDVSALAPMKDIFYRAKGVYLPDVLNRSRAKLSSFYRRYKAKYGVDPVGIQYMSYDVTRLALRCFKRLKKFDRNLYRDCLSSTAFVGTSGKISFELNSAFANRPIFFTNLKDAL
jgi:ABC-type branched-subunit amino acid transport system substrate-binding protein